MSLINVEHLTFSYPSSLEPVFKDVSFKLDTDWRLGLIGRNGRGKTTLLRLLLGEMPYSGTISNCANFVYFPQTPADPTLLARDVLAGLYPLAEDWQLRRELNLLGCDADEILWRPFDTLSGGEQTKALLAGLFLDDAAFPLIDEPTNHLDLAGREAVARYLSHKPGFILVSHDRRFLDAAVDHILAINASDIEIHNGNYSSWQDNFARREAHEKAQNARLQSEIRQLKQAAARTANWSDRVERTKIGADDKGHVGHMAAKMMKRSKAIETRRERAIEEKSQLLKNIEQDEPLKLVPLTYIDLASRLQIEALIKTYQPTMLLVEHDRAFRDAIATEVIQL